ncbi:arginine permease [Dactylonectria estremocensis]|uniref:Arginine permease n=1 Tax=Dactylonectria estremocensis TaxID=1079267 RepID=A0A9P9IL54_9HYPO|nr:arginine permease [Dactylonectria estremocensis]
MPMFGRGPRQNPFASSSLLAPLEDHGADSQLHRRLGTRHIAMIGLGGSIGMGLWLGSGSSLSKAGPASLFLGYVLAGTMIWSVSHSIGEMAVMYPLPSAFVQWTNMFVDPAAGFALGWAYTFAYWISIANELQGIVTVLSFWTDAVPVAAWITIFWAVIVLVNIGPVKVFAEIEVVSSAIKFGFIFVVIISGIVLSAGGGPKGGFPPVEGGSIGFEFWNSTPFINGAKGFFSIMPVCIFALAGSENASLVAGETTHPQRAVPKAVASIWVRLALFYIMGGLIVTINVSPNDPNLFGGGGTNASPFVIMYRNCGVMPLAHIMNAVIFISVLSTGTLSGYGASRILLGLSQINMAPKILQKTDSRGRPWYGLVPTLLIGGGLSYINISHSGAEVFTWLSNLSSLFTLFGWGMICLSHIRMRHAMKVQGRDHANLPWKSWVFPYAPYWGLFWCITLLVILFYLAISPLSGETSAVNFFSSYVSALAILALYVGAKIYYRNGRWVDTAVVDLDASRRFYHDEHLEEKKEQNGFVRAIRTAVF